MIQGIDVTYILSNNFDELVKWYNEKLSLEFGYGDSHWQEFVLEQGSRFAIHKSNSNYNKPNNIIISFKVEDINQTISQLQGQGIEFITENSEIIHDAGPSLIATIEDIDNNKIQFSQSK